MDGTRSRTAECDRRLDAGSVLTRAEMARALILHARYSRPRANAAVTR